MFPTRCLALRSSEVALGSAPCAPRWCLVSAVAAITIFGGAASQDQTEEALRRLLIEYMVFQDIHFAERGRYANDIATMSFTVPPGLTISIVASSATGHGAIARPNGGSPTLMCALWLGDPLPGMEYEMPATPVCGAPDRFEEAISAQREARADQVSRARQRPPVSATPPVIQSGVLLGLSDWQQQSYRTLWIAGHGDSAAVLASGPGLLVPRSDGFWWVNQAQDCTYVVAGPAAGWPDGAVAHGGDWAGAIPEECPWGSEGYEFEIHFVGPDYISVRWVGDAPSGRAVDSVDDHYVMFLDSLTQYAAIPVERFFPRSILTPLMQVAGRKADSLRQTGREECGWSTGSPPRDWSIVRGRGRWRLTAHYAPTPYFCGRITVPTSITAPEELVGYDQLFPDWDAITAVVPTAEDAVSSPRRDLVVVQTPDSLYAFHVDGDAVGRRVLAMADPQLLNIVMVQWAVGRHVQRWTDEVWELLNQLSAEDAR